MAKYSLADRLRSAADVFACCWGLGGNQVWVSVHMFDCVHGLSQCLSIEKLLKNYNASKLRMEKNLTTF